MRHWFRKCWPALKLLFTIAVLFLVGRQFASDLSDPRLWQRSIGYGWLAAAGVLYLLGLGMSAVCWLRLLHRLGEEPAILLAIRAYYLGHFGKYIPGKAWALVLRVSLARSAGVRTGIATITTFYEVMTTMTAGALVAAALFALMPHHSSAPWDWANVSRIVTFQTADTEIVNPLALVIVSLGLAAIVGLPLVPFVFNRLVHRLSLPFRDADAPPPAMPISALFEGLFWTSCGWFLHGASLWAVLRGIADQPLPFTFNSWALDTATLSMAYVAGFVVVIVPNGLGVREYFLTLLLAPHLVVQLGGGESEARALTVLAVIVLRVVWTAAELVLAAGLYWLPHENSNKLSTERDFPNNG